MSAIRSRTTRGMSTYVSVVISPATTTKPVVISVSHATRPPGSSEITASSTESEIWSATLSGWPSVTDSEVKRNSRGAIRTRFGMTLRPRGAMGGARQGRSGRRVSGGRRLAASSAARGHKASFRDEFPRRLRLLDLEERVERARALGALRPGEERAQWAQVLAHLARQAFPREVGEALEQRQRVLEVDVHEAAVRVGHPGRLLRLLEVGAVAEVLARAAEVRDPVQAARDHDLAADAAVVDRELAEIDRLHAMTALRAGLGAR